MQKFKNSEITKQVLKSLLAVSGRRTSESFAAMVTKAIILALENRYDFLKYVKIEDRSYLEGGDGIKIDTALDSIAPERIGKAIEIVIRVVWMDLKEKAGLFFIEEFKRNIGQKYILEIREIGVDLDMIQLEQHYLIRREERKKALKTPEQVQVTETKQNEEKSMLGYSWDNVSNWKFDPVTKKCTLYAKDGHVIDNIDLDAIIMNHVKKITEGDDSSETPAEVVEMTEKDYEFMHLLYSRDIDLDSALILLYITKDELVFIIQKLLKLQILQYITDNEIKLTEKGIDQLIAKKEEALEKK